MDDHLDLLAMFNREDWAGKPYLIELRGPRADDGRRFRWHELPPLWRQPESVSPVLAEDTNPWEARMPIADYQPTGSVTDDGAHVYEFYRYE